MRTTKSHISDTILKWLWPWIPYLVDEVQYGVLDMSHWPVHRGPDESGQGQFCIRLASDLVVLYLHVDVQLPVVVWHGLDQQPDAGQIAMLQGDVKRCEGDAMCRVSLHRGKGFIDFQQ